MVCDHDLSTNQEEMYFPAASLRRVGISCHVFGAAFRSAAALPINSSANGSLPLCSSPVAAAKKLIPSLPLASGFLTSNLASTFPFRGQLVEVAKRARNLPSSPVIP